MDRLKQLMQFYDENPDDPFVCYCIALEKVKQSQFDEALDWFTGLTKDHPDYVATYYHMGKLLEEMKRNDDASAAYQKGIEKARAQQDHHALSELMGAYNELENDFDVEFDD
jgi:tetratricopeptide (TPR) repeat protein